MARSEELRQRIAGAAGTCAAPSDALAARRSGIARLFTSLVMGRSLLARFPADGNSRVRTMIDPHLRLWQGSIQLAHPIWLASATACPISCMNDTARRQLKSQTGSSGRWYLSEATVRCLKMASSLSTAAIWA